MRYRTITARLHYTDAKTGEPIPSAKTPVTRFDRDFASTEELIYRTERISQDLNDLRERYPEYHIFPLWSIDDAPLDAFTIARKR